jgi:hypothetical protein
LGNRLICPVHIYAQLLQEFTYMQAKLRCLPLLIILSLFIPLLRSQRAQAEQRDQYYFYLPIVLNSPKPVPLIELVSLGGIANSTQIEIAPGETTILQVTARNRSRSVAGGIGSGIVIGFPGINDPALISQIAHDLEGAEIVWDSYYQLQVSTDHWQPGQQHFVSLELGPLRDWGTFPIYVKAVLTMMGPAGTEARYISPLNGKPGVRDADGEQSQVYQIQVADHGTGLGRLNYYRGLAGVPAATEIPFWSQGCTSHAFYLVMNGMMTHDEDLANPYYTYEGYAAGQSSNLVGFTTNGILHQESWPVDVLMQSLFHAVPMLEPRLTMAGYGQAEATGSSLPFAASLDVYRGVDYSAIPDYPVYWPPQNGVSPLVKYTGGETPDPLAHCGYAAPSGAPVFLIMGDGNSDPRLTAHSLKQDGVEIPHCAFDYETYTNPTPPHQRDGRDVLDYYDALVIIPRDPLQQGVTYTASITAEEQIYTWDFQVAPGYVDAPVGYVLPPTKEIK